MAPEALSKASNKTKLTIIAFIVVLIIIIWQVIGLLSGDKTGTTITPAKATVTTTASKTQTIASVAPTQATLQPVNTPITNGTLPALPSTTPGVPVLPKVAAPAPPTRDLVILKMQQDAQDRYLSQLNELQSLKIQREIAEASQAIATATLAKVTAEKNINEALTRPSQAQQAVVPTAAYANTMAGTAPQGPGNTPPPPLVESPSYVVISVSMELGRWQAVMGYQGALYHVSVGDVLPVDGSVVASITKSGVILKKDGVTRKVSMTSAI